MLLSLRARPPLSAGVMCQTARPLRQPNGSEPECVRNIREASWSGRKVRGRGWRPRRVPPAAGESVRRQGITSTDRASSHGSSGSTARAAGPGEDWREIGPAGSRIGGRCAFIANFRLTCRVSECNIQQLCQLSLHFLHATTRLPLSPPPEKKLPTDTLCDPAGGSFDLPPNCSSWSPCRGRPDRVPALPSWPPASRGRAGSSFRAAQTLVA